MKSESDRSLLPPLSILSLLDLEYLRLKFPNHPPHAFYKKTYSQKSANDIEASVVHCCRIHGFEAYRIKVTGRVLDTRKKYTDVLGFQRISGSLKWIKGTTPSGVADIDASIVPFNGSYAAPVKIEVKFGKDVQSEDQKRFESRIKHSKGFYIIIHSYDEFWHWFEEFIGVFSYTDHVTLIAKNIMESKDLP